MNTRSLVMHLFGEYLPSGSDEVRLRGLIAVLGCFGVPEPTVRVVVARLRREGWLSSRRDGRETSYALTDVGRRELRLGRSRIFERAQRPWDGRWHMVIYSVPETERTLREQLRRRLFWLGFGPLTSSVWLSPHDRVASVREGFADRPVVRMDTFHARTEDPEVDREMAARSWELDGLNREYGELLRRYRPRLARYAAGALDGEEALLERAALVQEFGRFPKRDPDLPRRLLPPDWSGTAAHEMFLRAHELLREPAERHARELLSGPVVRV